MDPRLLIAPGIIDYGFRPPLGLPRVMLANTISLLPGTLGAGMEGDILKVHVLDEEQDVAGEIAEVDGEAQGWQHLAGIEGIGDQGAAPCGSLQDVFVPRR
ncbi:MAG: Na+/H+ antiporter subunit E [Gammaproteobacteria bacterium]|nr:Na+/H+ antiporter subunit E [Gammaproteobacteria bacterium]